MIALIHAHPYPEHSRVNRALLGAARTLPGVEVRDLYSLYPDFHIDARAEQDVLARCDTLVLQHPLHWYNAPALLALWLEKVLAYGWAYGHDASGQAAHRLQGKRFIWVTTTGAGGAAYQASGRHHATMDEIATPMRLTATFCGMQWLAPHVVHAAFRLDDAALAQAAQDYRSVLAAEIEATAGASLVREEAGHGR